MSDTPKGETLFIENDPGEAVKFSFKPLPPGEIQGRIDFSKAETRHSEDSGLYRIGYAIQVVGSGKDGKKDRLVFSDFNLGVKPGRDGVLNYNRADQLLGFAHAAKVDFRTLMNGLDITTVHDKEGNEVKQIHPKQLLKRLKELGTVDVRLRIKVYFQDKNDKVGRNKVDFYIAANSKSSSKNDFLDDDDDDEDVKSSPATDVSNNGDLEEIK